ncbi:hypothetical protein SLS59_007929 [Nothophoma quercina]|uniref:Apple domain-containing protein n=1 Tax=Nothophoma quercina TaxID=749835 RepID=A0ABR3QVP8_9PLEO
MSPALETTARLSTQIFYYNGDIFYVECYTDYAGGDLSSNTPQYFSSFGDCVNACAAYKACNAVSYVGGTCYLKGAANPGSSNQNVWAAKQIGTYDTSTTQITITPTAVASSTTAATSSSTTGASTVGSSRVSSSAASPSSTGSAGANAACPGDDGKTYTTSAGTFTIECYVDRYDNDLGPASSNPTSYAACMDACAATAGCKGISYVPNGACYLKSGLGAPNTNNGVWGGSLSSGSGASTSTAAASSSVAASSGSTTTASSTANAGATTTSTGPVATSSVTCPGSDGQTIDTSAGTFIVECGVDRSGNDMADSPVYPGSYEACVSVCARRPGCMDVSYIPNGPCYLKSSAGAANQNANIIGGRLCYSDRYGDDIPGGTSYTNTLDDCIADCDNTDGCVDVSYIPGSPGPCYKKSSIADIRQNDNVFGARQLSQCTASTKLKLHRKRVVRNPTVPKKKPIQKRGVYGPDYTYTQGSTTITQTTTSTVVRYTTV